jgi:hypothetical protein
MIIQTTGIYAILADHETRAFKEWRFLTTGTECDGSLVLPQRALPKPEYDEKKQRLVEVVAIEETEVIQGWDIQDLTPEEIEARKRPNTKGFATEMIVNPELLAIYIKGRDGSSETQKWFKEVQLALAATYIPQGFQGVINALAQSVPLTKEEIETLNTALYKYDLELITWEGA